MSLNKHKSIKRVSKSKIKNKYGIELTRHHLIPKQRVKEETTKKDMSGYAFVRILWLWRNRHDAWHILFHNLTLHEIRLVIDRLDDMKQ